MKVHGTAYYERELVRLERLERHLREHNEKYKKIQHKINFLSSIINWLYK